MPCWHLMLLTLSTFLVLLGTRIPCTAMAENVGYEGTYLRKAPQAQLFILCVCELCIGKRREVVWGWGLQIFTCISENLPAHDVVGALTYAYKHIYIYILIDGDDERGLDNSLTLDTSKTGAGSSSTSNTKVTPWYAEAGGDGISTELGDSILSQEEAGQGGGNGANGDNGEGEPKAKHHHPFFPIQSRDFWGLLFAALGLMIAAGGGIGGGGILVPIFILVMGFSPKYAIPLSNVTILGGSIMNMVMNVSKRHPSADRPLVDWDLILIMEPLTIGGALAGSFLNKILPEWLLVVSLVILLGYTAQTTLDKGFKVYQKETEAKIKAA